MTEYEIQTRQKGAWLRYVGSVSREAMDKVWRDFSVQRCAARYVERSGGKVKLLAAKKHRPHLKQR